MSATDRLIRDVQREIDAEGHLHRDEWNAIKAKYTTKQPSRIPAKRAKPRVRKTVVRLHGVEMMLLREKVYSRDDGKCVDCKQGVYFFDWEAPVKELIMELSHVRSRGAGGGDTLENCVTRCRECHQKSHNCNGKPVPSKRTISSSVATTEKGMSEGESCSGFTSIRRQ